MAGGTREPTEEADARRGREQGRGDGYMPTRYAGGIGRRPEGEHDDREAIRRRVAWVRKRLGVDNLPELKSEVERFRDRKPTMRTLLRAAADSSEPPPESGTEDEVWQGARLSVEVAQAPTSNVSPGQTRRYIRVVEDRPFLAATLRLSLADEDVAHLYPETILVARWAPDGRRWDSARRRWHLIPHSGYDPAK